MFGARVHPFCCDSGCKGYASSPRVNNCIRDISHHPSYHIKVDIWINLELAELCMRVCVCVCDCLCERVYVWRCLCMCVCLYMYVSVCMRVHNPLCVASLELVLCVELTILELQITVWTGNRGYAYHCDRNDILWKAYYFLCCKTLAVNTLHEQPASAQFSPKYNPWICIV